MRTIEQLIRPNVRRMKPYSSARDEFHGSASVFMDANENPFDSGINRYPDPMQLEVKRALGEVKGIKPENLFLGNGSDEAIDLLLRAFCEPSKENAVSIDPSYGMYEVAANVNDVEFRKVRLTSDYDIDLDKLFAAIDENTKIVYLCSPNNPTGNSLDRNKIYRILREFDGIVVVDEAYIDFSSQPSFATELKDFPNLVVLQTLSKAWGAAGVRLGIAIAGEEIIAVLNKIKYPYNINVLTQQRVLELLAQKGEMKRQLAEILSERGRLGDGLAEMACVLKIHPTDANFHLVEVTDANAIYQYLVDNGIIVRNRTNVALCGGCLRITVGTKKENDLLLDALKAYES